MRGKINIWRPHGFSRHVTRTIPLTWSCCCVCDTQVVCVRESPTRPDQLLIGISIELSETRHETSSSSQSEWGEEAEADCLQVKFNVRCCRWSRIGTHMQKNISQVKPSNNWIRITEDAGGFLVDDKGKKHESLTYTIPQSWADELWVWFRKAKCFDPLSKDCGKWQYFAIFLSTHYHRERLLVMKTLGLQLPIVKPPYETTN